MAISAIPAGAVAQSATSLGTTPLGNCVKKGGCSVSYSIGMMGHAVVTRKPGVATPVEPEIRPEDIKLTAYPNPFTDEIRIVFPMSASPSKAPAVQVIDNSGKIESADAEYFNHDGQGEIVLSGHGLRQGHYIIRIACGSNVFAVKAIKL